MKILRLFPVLAIVGLSACDFAPDGWAAPEAPVPTPAGLIDARDAQAVMDIVARRGTGYWRRDGFRDPVIEMTTEDVAWQVEFYGCTSGTDCTDLRFVSKLPPPAESKGLNRRISAWNAEHRFGKVTTGEEDEIVLEMNTALEGGVTRQNFDLTLDWWLLALRQFTLDYGA
ncbi:YbjN domain-containing protein [Rhodobacteraceae bacterium NNCM2]|nr:YbjN domain-containing protein [Coraliihabitans acroporae]